MSLSLSLSQAQLILGIGVEWEGKQEGSNLVSVAKSHVGSVEHLAVCNSIMDLSCKTPITVSGGQND